MNNYHEIILKPLLTEKTSLLTEKGNRYAFQVRLNANKYQIKEAIEKCFNVKVVGINTLVRHGKFKRTSKGLKKNNSIKRAYVQVKEGQKIEFFKGI